jgi:hypothetical protein
MLKLQISQKHSFIIHFIKPGWNVVRHPYSQYIVFDNENLDKFKRDTLRSFDLENNNENLEQQDIYPFDYFLQSTTWLLSY